VEQAASIFRVKEQAMQENSKKWQQAELTLLKIKMKLDRSRAHSAFCLIFNGFYFHLLFDPEDEGDCFLQHNGHCLTYVALQPRKPLSSKQICMKTIKGKFNYNFWQKAELF
jgi:hypothetical protein